MPAILSRPLCVNSWWHTDAIWRNRSVSALVKVMLWWHQALTWTIVWLRTCEFHRHWFESNFVTSSQDISLYNEFGNYTLKTITTSPRGEWVNMQLLTVSTHLCLLSVLMSTVSVMSIGPAGFPMNKMRTVVLHKMQATDTLTILPVLFISK